MSEVVGLDGQRVDGEIPREDTPEAVLECLLEELRNGKVKVSRLTIIAEDVSGDCRYFTRTSLATTAEAMCLAAVAHQMFLDELLDK